MAHFGVLHCHATSRMPCTWLVLGLFLLSHSVCSYLDDIYTAFNQWTEDAYYLNMLGVNTSSFLGRIQCCARCSRDPTCFGVGWNQETFECRLAFRPDAVAYVHLDTITYWNFWVNGKFVCGTEICKTYKTSCKELRELGASRSGIYLVNFSSYELGLYNVSCDMESNGGGWTVFQRRQDGSENFYRGWQEYVHGFGDIASEFWLGNDLLHKITSSGEYTLRVDLGDFEGNATYAEYTGFSIAGAEEFYQLSISSYTGTAGDSLARHNGRNFSTWDADHDIQKTMNCALSFRGAWWYADCHNSNLNADYLGGFHDSFADGVNWGAFRGKYYSLKIYGNENQTHIIQSFIIIIILILFYFFIQLCDYKDDDYKILE